MGAGGGSFKAMTEPTTPARRQRAQATTHTGRQLLQKERGRLAKEQAALAEQLMNEVKAARDAVNDRQQELAMGGDRNAAIQRSVVRCTSGVLASERVNVPIMAKAADSVSAWTDFKSITVRYQEHDDPRVTLAALRGLLYHEGGH